MKMNACFELNLKLFYVHTRLGLLQQFRGAALFRHKHAVCSEEEFTSGKSSSNFTIAEESTDQRSTVPVALACAVFFTYLDS